MATPLPPHVLIVEDDEAMLALMERFLRRRGYETTAALNAATALTTHFPDDPWARALVDRLHGRYPKIPTLFISAFGSPDLCRAARNGGATDCLTKPFNMVTLVERVEALLPPPAASDESKAG